jgi:hypothetical protein
MANGARGLRTAAAARGDRYFETGVPCKRWHVGQRYTSDGGCVECAALRAAAWNAEHPGYKAAWEAARPGYHRDMQAKHRKAAKAERMRLMEQHAEQPDQYREAAD